MAPKKLDGENFVSGKLYLFSSISRLWAKFCGIFVQKFSAELWKVHFTSTEERFDDCFLENWNFFISFSDDTCKKLSNIWQKYFGKLVKIQVWVSRGTILRNKIFEKERSFSLFSYFEQKLLGLLARKLRQGCQKCLLRAHLTSCGNLCGKPTLFVWLSDYEWRIVNFLAENFRQACQKCNLSVQGNFFRSSCWSFFNFKPFFKSFDEKISVRLSKLHFTCLGEEFEPKYIFFENV